MNKLYIAIISIVISIQSFGIQETKKEDVVVFHEKEDSKSLKKELTEEEMKELKTKCFKESYYLITEINGILDKEISSPDQSLFKKIQDSTLWKTLNKENKEKFARNIMKWTLEGDEKIAEVKSKIAEYYLTSCENI